MRKPFTQLYVHLVWATWDRLPLITPQLQGRIYACIHAKSEELRCELLAIGGVEDHIHLLVRLPTTLSVAELVKEVKGASSHIVTHELDPESGFKWQGAYGAFTVSRSHLRRVIDYINHQPERHRDQTLHEDLEAVFEHTGSDPSNSPPPEESAPADFVPS